jgi:hypothetical protein
MAFRRGSRVKGGPQLRRALKAGPDIAEEELGQTMQGITARLLGRAKAEAPVRTGLLRGLLNARFMPKSLKIKLGLITRAAQRKGWYGYILDQGRKARTVKAKRRRADGSISNYMMRISGISRERYNFVFGRRLDFQKNELPKMRDAMQRALRRIARGAQADG